MVKELETLEKLISFAFVMSENMVGLTKGNYDENQFIKKTYEYLHKYNVDLNSKLELKKSLQRLESIDNASPSEALECLEHIKKDDFNMILTSYPPIPAYNGITKDEMFNKIEQALLKMQEKEKQYLKWEDLEFNLEKQMMTVLLNGTKYTLILGRNSHFDKLAFLRNGEINYYFLEADKQFFNDLRLERVEE